MFQLQFYGMEGGTRGWFCCSEQHAARRVLRLSQLTAARGQAGKPNADLRPRKIVCKRSGNSVGPQSDCAEESLTLCVEADAADVLGATAPCVRSTLPPHRPRPNAAEACWLRSVGLGCNMRSMRVPCFELGSEMSKGFQHGLKVLTIVLHSLGLGEAELEEAPRDTKSHTISHVPPPRSKPSAAATSLHVGLVRRQCEAAATSYGNPVHVPATAQAFISPELAYTLELSKHVDLARVHQVRRGGRLTQRRCALSQRP